jgi:hypothetical protein
VIASVGPPEHVTHSSHGSHVSKSGRKLVVAGFVAFIVIAVLFVWWLKSYRDDDR